MCSHCPPDSFQLQQPVSLLPYCCDPPAPSSFPLLPPLGGAPPEHTQQAACPPWTLVLLLFFLRTVTSFCFSRIPPLGESERILSPNNPFFFFCCFFGQFFFFLLVRRSVVAFGTIITASARGECVQRNENVVLCKNFFFFLSFFVGRRGPYVVPHFRTRRAIHDAHFAGGHTNTQKACQRFRRAVIVFKSPFHSFFFSLSPAPASVCCFYIYFLCSLPLLVFFFAHHETSWGKEGVSE